jgi:hypothetical protein
MTRALADHLHLLQPAHGDGRTINFWKEGWSVLGILKEVYPRAFATTSDKEGTVSRFWSYSSCSWNLNEEESTRRGTQLWEERRKLLSDLESFTPRIGVEDKYIW